MKTPHIPTKALGMKKLSSVVAILTLSAILASCGGGGETSSGTDDATVQGGTASGSTSTSYYTVSGASRSQLRNSLNANGPNGYWGYTEWFVSYNYTPVTNSDGSCANSSVTTTYTCQITLPKWNQPVDATNDAIGAWSSMISALTQHEKNHCNTAIALAQDARNGILSLNTSSCETMGSAVATEWSKHYQNALATDKNYDATTNHGISEGATL